MPVPGSITQDIYSGNSLYLQNTVIPINVAAVAAQGAANGVNQAAWIAYLTSAQAAENASKIGWQTFFSGVLALLGAYKQYDMYEKMGEMYEAQKDYLDETREIMRDNYYNLFKPQYQASTGFLWNYVNNWGRGIIEAAAACGSRVCEYTRDSNVFNRAMSQIPSFVNKAKRTGMRSLKRGQVGACCDNEFRFAALQAGLMTKALNLAERYEDDKALRWNTFYWGRMTGAAQMAGNQYSIAANLVTGAGSGLNSVVSQMGNSASAGFQGAQLGMDALGNKANFWGGLGNISGMMSGQQYGLQTAEKISGLGSSMPSATSMGSPAGLQASQSLSLPGFMSSSMTDSDI